MMEKPLTVKAAEFKAKMEAVINSCGLPAVLVAAILSGYCVQVEQAVKEQTEKDFAAYQKAQAEESEQSKVARKKEGKSNGKQ